MAVFQSAAGTAFRAENFGIDYAGAFSKTGNFHYQIFDQAANQSGLYLSFTDQTTHQYLGNITSTLPITLDHSTFDDPFDTSFYMNEAIRIYAGVTSDFAFYDYATGSAVLVGSLTGAVYSIAVVDSYQRVLTETQEISHMNSVASFPGVFAGDDTVTLGGLADYFCDPRGDLSLHMGGGDDLGLHMSGNADDQVTVWGDAGNDRISTDGGQGALFGGGGRDWITGYSDSAYDVYGGRNGDLIYLRRGVIHDDPGSGNDDYSGDGSGLALLTYETATRGIVVDLWNGFAHGRDIGNDTVVGLRQLRGGQGDDQLIGMPSLVLSEFGVTIWGDTGNDSITGTSQADHLFGEAGNDRLTGYDGADLLTGGAGNDRLSGSAGDDTLLGGSGRDVLTGEGGADIFAFNAINESSPLSPDRITDFAQTEDHIDLHRIDARGGGRDNAFDFIGTAAFTAAGQVRMVQSGGDTVIEMNTVGSTGAEMTLVLTGQWTLTAEDFVL